MPEDITEVHGSVSEPGEADAADKALDALRAQVKGTHEDATQQQIFRLGRPKPNFGVKEDDDLYDVLVGNLRGVARQVVANCPPTRERSMVLSELEATAHRIGQAIGMIDRTGGGG